MPIQIFRCTTLFNAKVKGQGRGGGEKWGEKQPHRYSCANSACRLDESAVLKGEGKKERKEVEQAPPFPPLNTEGKRGWGWGCPQGMGKVYPFQKGGCREGRAGEAFFSPNTSFRE